MELDEVVRRILRRHARLIIAAVLVGVLAVLYVRADDPARYVATVRLVLDSPDPTTQSQSGALADTARAIASGPVLVRQALEKAGARRDPVRFGERNLDVQPLGSSGVLALSVTDVDRGVAVEVANAIAEAVIRTRADVTAGRATAAEATLTEQIKELDERLAQLDERIDGLVTLEERIDTLTRLSEQDQRQPVDAAELAAAARDRSLVLALERARDSAARRQDRLVSELTVIRGERALRPTASVLDPATVALPTPSGLVPDVVLGGLFGLVLGVGVAAGREVFWPTLGGAPALRRATGAPVLAELPTPPDECGPEDLAEAAEHVELAARAAGVGRVEVMSLVPDLDIRGFVAALDSALDASDSNRGESGPTLWRPVALGPAGGRGPRVMPGSRRNGVVVAGDPNRAGLVLVTPDQARLADLEPVRNLLTITSWPLLGVVVYRSRRTRFLRRTQRGASHSIEEELRESASVNGR